MNKNQIEYILDSYGLSRILNDHNLSKASLLQILDDQDYIDLGIYTEEEVEDE